MRTLHLYLIRQVAATLVMTVAVFTFVLLLGNVLREVISLLVNGQAGFLTLLRAVALLIPFVLVFALPMGMLTAALLVFGRFSADQELTAVRAGGVSLVALVTPVLLLSLVASGVCAWVNLQIAPQCRMAYKRLLFNVGVNRGGLLLPEKTFIKDIPNCIIYVSRVEGTNLSDVRFYQFEGGREARYVWADAGSVEFEPMTKLVTVHLRESWSMNWVEGRPSPTPTYAAESDLFYTNDAARAEEKIPLSDMTFSQLREELRAVEKRMAAPLPRPTAGPRAGVSAEWRRQREDLTLPVRVQLHRQVSFSFACVGFTLVGIPLGIRAHRRETTFGIAVALGLVFIYYSFFIVGQALDTRPLWCPHLILWVPNFLFEAVGAVLLWRANRGLY